MLHAVGGYYRFAHIDGLIPSDRAVYARPLQVHRDESCTQGLDRLELIRFLQVAQTISVHHGALAHLLDGTPTRAPGSTTTGPEATSTDTASTSSPHTLPASGPPPHQRRLRP